jgi:excisionase family DNA binding protein
MRQLSCELPDRPLISTAEVSRAYGISPETVRKLAAEGVLRPIRFSARGRLRFPREQVLQLIEHGFQGEEATAA